MGFDSPVHWLIVIFVIALLFGGSRVGGLMGELGKGLRSLKQNLGEPDEAARPRAGQAGQAVGQMRIAGASETAFHREAEPAPSGAPPIVEPALPPEAGRR